MINKLLPVLLASAVAACTTPGAPLADRGVEVINQPVLNRSTFAVDLSAPGGILAPSEVSRLGDWFRTLELGYGDSIYVDGAYADTARQQVADVAGDYGMMVLAAAPVTAGAVPDGAVRVIVSRTRAEVPNCPNWSVPSQPNYENRSMSNLGCAVNSDLAAMVADPQDLFHGREGAGVGDTITAAKAVGLYRRQVPTGQKGLQDMSTKKDKN
jgi:pilus assembly protein CpaD